MMGFEASAGGLRGAGAGGGFSTAGGAAIQVSETALRAARGVLAGTGGAGDTAPSRSSVAPRVRRTHRAPADPELEMDWGDEDEESLAALAELSELQPYTCRPWDLAPHPAPYRGGPDILDCPEQEGAEGGFVTPFTGPQKRRAGPEVDLGSVLGKRARKEMEEQEEEEEKEVMLSVEELRAVARGRQEALVAAKRSRRIRPMPGRLLSKRSSHTRLAPEELMTRCELFATHHCSAPYLRWVGCSEAVARVSFRSAASWVFEGREYFSSEAVEGNTGGLAVGDGAVVVLGGRGQVSPHIARHLSARYYRWVCRRWRGPSCAAPGWTPAWCPRAGWRITTGQLCSRLIFTPQHCVTPCCRWIVWSLASRERRQGVAALAPAAVMDRLKLRWEL